MTNPFRRIVWSLAVGETIVWAAFYYLFPALLLEWERDLGWSKTELAGAFTLSLVVFAALAPVAGRLIDRGYEREVFSGSAFLGALALLALSQVTALWHFYAVWVLLGIAMAGCLYEACFAVLTRLMGERARQAIIRVTLVAGLAGTVSFPGANVMTDLLGWRGAVVIFGVSVIVVALPLIWVGCTLARQQGEGLAPRPSHQSSETLRVLGNPIFWLLAGSFSMITLNHSTLVIHLLPLLDERDIHPGTAVLAASMIGPMQVTGRLLMMAVEKRVSIMAICFGCFAGTMVATLALLGSSSVPMLVAAFVVFQGASYGVTSITRPVVTAELLGRQNFGVVSGFMAVPFIGATAAAPTLGALIWLIGGYDSVILVALAATAVGCIALIAALHLARTR